MILVLLEVFILRILLARGPGGVSHTTNCGYAPCLPMMAEGAKPSIGARSAGIAAWAAQLWERASWGERDMIRQKLGDLIRRNSGTGQTLLALAHKVLRGGKGSFLLLREAFQQAE